MEFELPTTTNESVSQPYISINNQTPKTVQNFDLGNILKKTEDYPIVSHVIVDAQIYPAIKTITTTNYEAKPIYLPAKKYIKKKYKTVPTSSKVVVYPVITTENYATNAYETASVEIEPATTVIYNAYKEIPASTISFQVLANPVTKIYPIVVAPSAQTATGYKQVFTITKKPKFVTTKNVPLKKVKTESLFIPQIPMVIPKTTSLIQIPQPLTQQLYMLSQPSNIPQPDIVSQPMIFKVIPVPLKQSNPEEHFVKNYPLSDRDPRRMAKRNIFPPKSVNNNMNDFRVRTGLEPIVNPVLKQNGFVSEVNTNLPGVNSELPGLYTGLNNGLNTKLNNGLNTGLNTGLNEGLKTGLNEGLNTGLNNGLNQVKYNLTNTSNNLTSGINNPLNNVQNNLNNATHNYTLNNANRKIFVENIKDEYNEILKKLF